MSSAPAKSFDNLEDSTPPQNPLDEEEKSPDSKDQPNFADSYLLQYCTSLTFGCLTLCATSLILLALSSVRKWGEYLSNGRRLSASNAAIPSTYALQSFRGNEEDRVRARGMIIHCRPLPEAEGLKLVSISKNLFPFTDSVSFDGRKLPSAGDSNFNSVVTLFAGSTSKTSGTSNGIGTSAKFHSPSGISISSDGSFAVIAEEKNTIRKMIISTAEVSFLAGGAVGTNNGIGTNVQFYSSSGISLSLDDTYALIVDTGNSAIRKILISTSEVTSLAGGGSTSAASGYANGIGSNALFNTPYEATLSSDGNSFFIADTVNNLIRKLTISTAEVSVVAGGDGSTTDGLADGIGTNSMFRLPSGITLSSDDSFALMTDSGNYAIRKLILSTLEVSLLAGGGGSFGTTNGIGTIAEFLYPYGITLSSDDSYALVVENGNSMIRKVMVSTAEVSLMAGGGSTGSSNGIGSNALFDVPRQISIIPGGDYALITDTSNNQIRRIGLVTTAAPTTVPTAVPSLEPTTVPSSLPSTAPTTSPTTIPSPLPTVAPSIPATYSPSTLPTLLPSTSPTVVPSPSPTQAPSTFPTYAPSAFPTMTPTSFPTTVPSSIPTGAPTSLAIKIEFLHKMTSHATSLSLYFIAAALVLVMLRAFVMRPQIRSSSLRGQVKIFEALWWIGYSICCGVSMIISLVAVTIYAENLSDESEGRYFSGFYLCLVSIVTSFGALLCTPELFAWMFCLQRQHTQIYP